MNWTLGVRIGSKIPTPTPSILRSPTPSILRSPTPSILRSPTPSKNLQLGNSARRSPGSPRRLPHEDPALGDSRVCKQLRDWDRQPSDTGERVREGAEEGDRLQ